MVVAQLPFELVPDPVDRRGNVLGLGFGPEGFPRDPQGRLDPLEPVDARMVLVDELDVDPRRARLEARQRSQLPLGRHTDVLGDPHAAAREAQIHPLGTPRPSGGLTSG